MKFYSQETGAFYDPTINPEIPTDAIAVPDEQHAALLDEQSTGRVITVVDGEVVTIEREIDEVAIRRKEIERELSRLDAFVPRSTEEIIAFGAIPVSALSEYNQERLATKQALRAELAELG